MLALIIVAGILLFFLLLSLLRVGFEADYSADGLEVRLKVACFHIRLYPGRPSKQKHAKQSKDSAPPEGTDRPSQEQKKKLGDLKQLLEFSGPILEALGRLRRKLRIELLRLEYCIGGAEDPANAAIQYGIVSAGGGVLIPLLDQAFDVRKWDVQLDVDFDHAASRVAASAEGSWRLGTLVCIMLSLGISALKVYNNRQNATQATDKKEDVPNGRKASDR